MSASTPSSLAISRTGFFVSWYAIAEVREVILSAGTCDSVVTS